ncbi:RICIN domain-containing protein [Amycolatopsis sp. NPDC057786]|uniref:RICIN domain-containing protein n=1 Tax=Amycolatopsis sp. NPDC057786 TaxID=3346250 RepID=UPI003670A3D8
MRRILSVLAVVIAVCAWGAPQASAKSVGPGPYTIQNDFSHLCVDVAYGSLSSGARVQQWNCYNGTPERWRFEYYGWSTAWSTAGESYYRVVNVNSGKCLEVRDGYTGPGGIIQQYDCWNGPMQLWTPRQVGATDMVQLVNFRSGKCLDDTDWSTWPGTSLQQIDCGAWRAQYWHLYPQS